LKIILFETGGGTTDLVLLVSCCLTEAGFILILLFILSLVEAGTF
jgi:hypothetical protein